MAGDCPLTGGDGADKCVGGRRGNSANNLMSPQPAGQPQHGHHRQSELVINVHCGSLHEIS